MAQDVEHLIQIALHNREGEMVEGGFVDRWESYSASAVDALADLFDEKVEALIRTALTAQAPPPDLASALLVGLGPKGLRLIQELVNAHDPVLRQIYVLSASAIADKSEWTTNLVNPSPLVRVTALESLAKARRKIPEANELFIRALVDPDRRVRLAACTEVRFSRAPEGAEALLKLLDTESDDEIRQAVVSMIAQTVRREGVTVDGVTLLERVGESVKDLLIRELSNPAPSVRTEVAGAMERLPYLDVAAAMLARLRVEHDPDTRHRLLLFTHYPLVGEAAFPVIAHVLATEEDPASRTWAAFLLEKFGPEAAPALVAALRDDPGPRRAAAMSLAKVGNCTHIPLLATMLAKPENRFFKRELESAIRDLGFAPPPTVDPKEIALALDTIIQMPSSDDDGSWTIREMRDRHQAVPIAGNQIYLWALNREGTVLCMDHESFSHETEIETEPLAVFAVKVRAAMKYPELAPLVSQPPIGARLCSSCLGQEITDEGSCMSCGGLGWTLR